MIFGWINTLILLAISVLHVYWAVGGRWAHQAALPVMENGDMPKPGSFMTFMVAVAVALMAVLHLLRMNVIETSISSQRLNFGLYGLTVVFTLRAIGEFRYVGFFKRPSTSRFAYLDTRFYSPLCLLIAINALFTNLMI